jgi:hypothetical protein
MYTRCYLFIYSWASLKRAYLSAAQHAFIYRKINCTLALRLHFFGKPNKLNSLSGVLDPPWTVTTGILVHQFILGTVATNSPHSYGSTIGATGLISGYGLQSFDDGHRVSIYQRLPAWFWFILTHSHISLHTTRGRRAYLYTYTRTWTRRRRHLTTYYSYLSTTDVLKTFQQLLDDMYRRLRRLLYTISRATSTRQLAITLFVSPPLSDHYNHLARLRDLSRRDRQLFRKRITAVR